MIRKCLHIKFSGGTKGMYMVMFHKVRIGIYIIHADLPSLVTKWYVHVNVP